MSSIADGLLAQLQGPLLQQLAGKVGGDESAVRNATNQAIPLLLGAMARNASSPGGAESLLSAVERDHDGGILDNLQSFLGASTAPAEGAGILRHLLGGRTPAAASAIGTSSGLDASQVGSLLTLLAPMVMGALGKEQRAQKLDATALARSLAGETRATGSGSGAMGLLTSLFDRDGDGSVLDEAGSALLGLLRRK